MQKIKINNEKDRYLYYKYCNINKKEIFTNKSENCGIVYKDEKEKWENFKFKEEKKLKNKNNV
jgi:hypothetical protein